MIKIFKGKLIGHFETGTEGVLWALKDDELPRYEGLILLEAGDLLKIYSNTNELVYEGKVVPNRVVGAAKRPNSDLCQPIALGQWIHWTQDGFEPDKWASYFIKEEYTGIIKRRTSSLTDE